MKISREADFQKLNEKLGANLSKNTIFQFQALIRSATGLKDFELFKSLFKIMTMLLGAHFLTLVENLI